MTSDITTIEPAIFESAPQVQAFFTLKNRELAKPDDAVEGLNLGLNTPDSSARVEANRRRLLAAHDIDPAWIAYAGQVHSNRVRIITSGGTFPETDGLITRVPGLALAIQVADCAAVLIADPESRTIAAVHAGWRGAAGDILPVAVDKMRSLGVDPADCLAYISPCISLRHFEVGEEVADQFPAGFVERRSYRKPHVNLKGFLKHQLEEEGMKSGRIEVDPSCTVAEDRFYSFRREKEQSGRMIGLIKINERE